MLPLGVEKWHATFDLLGRLHAKWPDAPRAPDALADPEEAKHEYGIDLVPLGTFADLDGLILAVPHRVLGEPGWHRLFASLVAGGVFVDVKSAIPRRTVPPEIHYWSL